MARSTACSTPIPIPIGSATRAYSYRSSAVAPDDDDDDNEECPISPGRESSGSSSPLSPPSPLAAIVEPIREVLEDMRQQRMSLCQSLRQYIFVHLVVVVGAFGIVDEVKAELDEQGVHSPIYQDTYAPPNVQVSPARLSLPQVVSQPIEASLEDKHTITVANLAQFDAEGGMYTLGKRGSIKRKLRSVGSGTDEGPRSHN